MYNYVGDLCSIYHFIINNYIENKKAAIDATLGNGHDTDFLSKNFNKVYGDPKDYSSGKYFAYTSKKLSVVTCSSVIRVISSHSLSLS